MNAFVYDIFNSGLMNAVYNLDSDTLKIALIKSTYVSDLTAWQASTAYSVGAIRIPTSRNFHRYKCVTAGTSGTSEPIWDTTQGGTVTDGTVVWKEMGSDVAHHESWGGSILEHETTGTNYPEGGITLSGLTVTQYEGRTVFDANDVIYNTLTADFQFAVMYIPEINTPIMFFVLDTQTISVISSNFAITFSSSGILELAWA